MQAGVPGGRRAGLGWAGPEGRQAGRQWASRGSDPTSSRRVQVWVQASQPSTHNAALTRAVGQQVVQELVIPPPLTARAGLLLLRLQRLPHLHARTGVPSCKVSLN